MRILWSINTVPKEVLEKLGNKITSRHAISWVDAMSKRLKKNDAIELFMAVPGDKHTEKLENIVVDDITYYILPHDHEKCDYWREILCIVKPNIIHAYGTEGRHNVMLIKKYAAAIPIVISLQGIISEYVKYYYAGLSKIEILRNCTIEDIIHKKGIFIGKLSFYKQTFYEKFMLNHVNYVEGRSDWDYMFSAAINPNLKYYYCPRMIRKEFFDYNWEYKSCEKHVIFMHQANYPIKGFHFMIEALHILKRYYPDAKLYISGSDVYSSKKASNGYIKLTKRRIDKYNLGDSITFTGYLNADALAQYLCKVNVCVVPSAIENAPNSLAEAMVVGTPCIASDVGGNANMLNYGEAGLLYCYDEPEMLADRIKKYFDDTELCCNKAIAGVRIARDRHDPQRLVDQLLGIYKQVIDDFNCKGTLFGFDVG